MNTRCENRTIRENKTRDTPEWKVTCTRNGAMTQNTGLSCIYISKAIFFINLFAIGIIHAIPGLKIGR